MELSVLATSGLPDHSVISVRTGTSRRQSPLPCAAPFLLPAPPRPLRIDVLAWRAWSRPEEIVAGRVDDGRLVKVPLDTADGRPASVTMRLVERPRRFDADRTDSGEEATETPRVPKGSKKETQIDNYLKRHRFQEFMRSLFQLLLREQPEDPYAFIAKKFAEAAAMLDKVEVPRSLRYSSCKPALLGPPGGPPPPWREQEAPEVAKKCRAPGRWEDQGPRRSVGLKSVRWGEEADPSGRPEQLRRRAQAMLTQAAATGGLGAALRRLGPGPAHKAKAPEQLRRHAFETLTEASATGRLSSALETMGAGGGGAASWQPAGRQPSSGSRSRPIPEGRAQALRERAKEELLEASAAGALDHALLRLAAASGRPQTQAPAAATSLAGGALRPPGVGRGTSPERAEALRQHAHATLDEAVATGTLDQALLRLAGTPTRGRPSAERAEALRQSARGTLGEALASGALDPALLRLSSVAAAAASGGGARMEAPGSGLGIAMAAIPAQGVSGPPTRAAGPTGPHAARGEVTPSRRERLRMKGRATLVEASAAGRLLPLLSAALAADDRLQQREDEEQVQTKSVASHEDRERAAVSIQSQMRGFLTRKIWGSQEGDAAAAAKREAAKQQAEQARREAAGLREEAAQREAARKKAAEDAKREAARREAEDKAKREAQAREQAAVKIQALARGKAGRDQAAEEKARRDAAVREAEESVKEVEALRLAAEARRREQAAVKIQAVARGKAARNQVAEEKARRDAAVREAEEAVGEVAALRLAAEASRGRGKAPGGKAPERVTAGEEQRREQAAVKIEAMARGKAARNEVAALKESKAEAASAVPPGTKYSEWRKQHFGGQAPTPSATPSTPAPPPKEVQAPTPSPTPSAPAQLPGAAQAAEEEQRREEAAVKIQAMARGKAARNKVAALKESQAPTLLVTPPAPEHLPGKAQEKGFAGAMSSLGASLRHQAATVSAAAKGAEHALAEALGFAGHHGDPASPSASSSSTGLRQRADPLLRQACADGRLEHALLEVLGITVSPAGSTPTARPTASAAVQPAHAGMRFEAQSLFRLACLDGRLEKTLVEVLGLQPAAATAEPTAGVPARVSAASKPARAGLRVEAQALLRLACLTGRLEQSLAEVLGVQLPAATKSQAADAQATPARKPAHAGLRFEAQALFRLACLDGRLEKSLAEVLGVQIPAATVKVADQAQVAVAKKPVEAGLRFEAQALLRLACLDGRLQTSLCEVLGISIAAATSQPSAPAAASPARRPAHAGLRFEAQSLFRLACLDGRLEKTLVEVLGLQVHEATATPAASVPARVSPATKPAHAGLRFEAQALIRLACLDGRLQGSLVEVLGVQLPTATTPPAADGQAAPARKPAHAGLRFEAQALFRLACLDGRLEKSLAEVLGVQLPAATAKPASDAQVSLAKKPAHAGLRFEAQALFRLACMDGRLQQSLCEVLGVTLPTASAKPSADQPVVLAVTPAAPSPAKASTAPSAAVAAPGHESPPSKPTAGPAAKKPGAPEAPPTAQTPVPAQKPEATPPAEAASVPDNGMAWLGSFAQGAVPWHFGRVPTAEEILEAHLPSFKHLWGETNETKWAHEYPRSVEGTPRLSDFIPEGPLQLRDFIPDPPAELRAFIPDCKAEQRGAILPANVAPDVVAKHDLPSSTQAGGPPSARLTAFIPDRPAGQQVPASRGLDVADTDTELTAFIPVGVAVPTSRDLRVPDADLELTDFIPDEHWFSGPAPASRGLEPAFSMSFGQMMMPRLLGEPGTPASVFDGTPRLTQFLPVEHAGRAGAAARELQLRDFDEVSPETTPRLTRFVPHAPCSRSLPSSPSMTPRLTQFTPVPARSAAAARGLPPARGKAAAAGSPAITPRLSRFAPSLGTKPQQPVHVQRTVRWELPGEASPAGTPRLSHLMPLPRPHTMAASTRDLLCTPRLTAFMPSLPESRPVGARRELDGSIPVASLDARARSASPTVGSGYSDEGTPRLTMWMPVAPSRLVETKASLQTAKRELAGRAAQWGKPLHGHTPFAQAAGGGQCK